MIRQPREENSESTPVVVLLKKSTLYHITLQVDELDKNLIPGGSQNRDGSLFLLFYE